MKIVTNLLLIALILVACSAPSVPSAVANETRQEQPAWFEHSIMDTVTPNVMNRYIDLEAGIVCYISYSVSTYKVEQMGGMAMQCFLIKETRLDK